MVIGNLFECTGTLVNNTARDGRPYILTARHCENGQLGGGNPDAAATVSVYWDAVTPCGTPLYTLYDEITPSQSGAVTALEQQDLWLIQLDAPPAANDAYYAGWDASGAAFSGGYTIHQALGEDQQYVEWGGIDVFEQLPAATLSIAYDSTFWGVVNTVGNIGAGGSGSALFSPGNQVVGTGEPRGSERRPKHGRRLSGSTASDSLTDHGHGAFHRTFWRMVFNGRPHQFHRQQNIEVYFRPRRHRANDGDGNLDAADYLDCQYDSCRHRDFDNA